jgi:hypothetical protein
MSRPLDRAEKAIDMVKSWKNTVDNIKQPEVMHIVGPTVKVCPISTLRGANFRPLEDMEHSFLALPPDFAILIQV